MTHPLRPVFAACLAAFIVAACGGGSDGVAAPPAVATLEINGTAATGAALANAAVQVKCAVGSATATTSSEGRYAVEIVGGNLPCMVAVATSGGALHSLAAAGGTIANVNVTPLSELVVARLAGTSPAALFASFDAAAQARATPLALDAAINAVRNALQGTIDLAGVDPLRDALVAATPTNPGNALDAKLDTLQATLAAARVTLAEVATAFAADGDIAAPVRTMLQPAAANCAGFRSGRYAWVAPVENDVTTAGFTLVSLDAATLTMTYSNGTANQVMALTDDSGCAYSTPNNGQGSSKLLVSKSGIAVVRDTDTAGPQAGVTFVSGIVVPLQTIALAELAGTWNLVDYFRETVTSGFVPGRGTLFVDSAGKVTSYNGCDAAGVCRPESITNDAFTINAEGGFNVGGSAAEPPSRAFAYKTANGQLSMFLKYSNGRGVMVLSKQTSLALPAPGAVSNIWDFTITSSGAASALVEQSTTVTAVDAAAGTYTRIRASDSRFDSFKTDNPQAGMRSRAANTCSANGAPVACAGISAMPLPGTGITTYISAAPANFFGISIGKP